MAVSHTFPSATLPSIYHSPFFLLTTALISDCFSSVVYIHCTVLLNSLKSAKLREYYHRDIDSRKPAFEKLNRNFRHKIVKIRLRFWTIA